MKRIIATFVDSDDAAEARHLLRDVDLEPEKPDIENPFFDPATNMPEGRGLRWGGIVGGILGALVLFALGQNAIVIPRISPIMTAGPYVLVVLGFGVGTAVGSFIGGVIGTIRPVPAREQSRVAVVVPDHRTDEATDLLRDAGAETVEDAVTHHRHPLREHSTTSPASDGDV